MLTVYHWFQHFVAKFHQYFQGKDLILCFELNILDDLKIVDYRKFSLMQQTVSFLCLFFNDHYTVWVCYIYRILAITYLSL